MIENYEEKLLNFQSNQKSSEKINMNEKLLEEVTKERDEVIICFLRSTNFILKQNSASAERTESNATE